MKVIAKAYLAALIELFLRINIEGNYMKNC